MMFYDAPSQPSGIFDNFLAIPSLSYDVSVRDYLDLVLTEDVAISANLRCVTTPDIRVIYLSSTAGTTEDTTILFLSRKSLSHCLTLS